MLSPRASRCPPPLPADHSPRQGVAAAQSVRPSFSVPIPLQRTASSDTSSARRRVASLFPSPRWTNDMASSPSSATARSVRFPLSQSDYALQQANSWKKIIILTCDRTSSTNFRRCSCLLGRGVLSLADWVVGRGVLALCYLLGKKKSRVPGICDLSTRGKSLFFMEGEPGKCAFFYKEGIKEGWYIVYPQASSPSLATLLSTENNSYFRATKISRIP